MAYYDPLGQTGDPGLRPMSSLQGMYVEPYAPYAGFDTTQAHGDHEKLIGAHSEFPRTSLTARRRRDGPYGIPTAKKRVPTKDLAALLISHLCLNLAIAAATVRYVAFRLGLKYQLIVCGFLLSITTCACLLLHRHSS